MKQIIICSAIHPEQDKDLFDKLIKNSTETNRREFLGEAVLSKDEIDFIHDSKDLKFYKYMGVYFYLKE